MIELDEIDFRMIEILQLDGRTPILELADRVELSPTPCSQRRLRLEREGIIAKYCAAVNVKAIGKPSRVWSKKRESAHDTNRVLQTARFLKFSPYLRSLQSVIGFNLQSGNQKTSFPVMRIFCGDGIVPNGSEMAGSRAHPLHRRQTESYGRRKAPISA